MTNQHGCDHQLFILNFTHDTIVADPIAPKPPFVAHQGFASAAWVCQRRNFIFKVIKDGRLPWAIQFLQLPFGCGKKFNAPGQVVFSDRPN